MNPKLYIEEGAEKWEQWARAQHRALDNVRRLNGLRHLRKFFVPEDGVRIDLIASDDTPWIRIIGGGGAAGYTLVSALTAYHASPSTVPFNPTWNIGGTDNVVEIELNAGGHAVTPVGLPALATTMKFENELLVAKRADVLHNVAANTIVPFYSTTNTWIEVQTPLTSTGSPYGALIQMPGRLTIGVDGKAKAVMLRLSAEQDVEEFTESYSPEEPAYRYLPRWDLITIDVEAPRQLEPVYDDAQSAFVVHVFGDDYELPVTKVVNGANTELWCYIAGSVVGKIRTLVNFMAASYPVGEPIPAFKLPSSRYGLCLLRTPYDATELSLASSVYQATHVPFSVSPFPYGDVTTGYDGDGNYVVDQPVPILPTTDPAEPNVMILDQATQIPYLGIERTLDKSFFWFPGYEYQIYEYHTVTRRDHARFVRAAQTWPSELPLEALPVYLSDYPSAPVDTPALLTMQMRNEEDELIQAGAISLTADEASFTASSVTNLFTSHATLKTAPPSIPSLGLYFSAACIRKSDGTVLFGSADTPLNQWTANPTVEFFENIQKSAAFGNVHYTRKITRWVQTKIAATQFYYTGTSYNNLVQVAWQTPTNELGYLLFLFQAGSTALTSYYNQISSPWATYRANLLIVKSEMSAADASNPPYTTGNAAARARIDAIVVEGDALGEPTLAQKQAWWLELRRSRRMTMLNNFASEEFMDCFQSGASYTIVNMDKA